MRETINGNHCPIPNRPRMIDNAPAGKSDLGCGCGCVLALGWALLIIGGWICVLAALN